MDNNAEEKNEHIEQAKEQETKPKEEVAAEKEEKKEPGEPKKEEPAKPQGELKPKKEGIEKPTEEEKSVCAKCGKKLKKKSSYYRNGKYYCNKRCWKGTRKKPEEGSKK